MLRFRVRSLRALLLATVLTSTVAAPVAAAPGALAPSMAIGTVEKVKTAQHYPFDLAYPSGHFYNPGASSSRAAGSIVRTENWININGFLDDSGPGSSVLSGTIFWRSGTRHDFLYTSDDGRRTINYTWTLDTKAIKEVNIVLCKYYRGMGYRCAKSFTASFTAPGGGS